jgi:hypothetical protein
MATAVVAKVRPTVNADVEVTRLQAKVDDLDGQLLEARRDYDRLLIEADRWRALAERYQGREEQQRPAGPDFGVHQITEEMRLRMQAQFQAQQLMAMAQSQQANMQQAQQAQALAQQNCFQGNLMGLGHVGALGSQAQALEWCNCVPARHDMFLRGD